MGGMGSRVEAKETSFQKLPIFDIKSGEKKNAKTNSPISKRRLRYNPEQK